MTADEIVDKLERAKKTGSGWIARCPAHQDREPSLSISTGEDGRTLLNCHAGCTTDAICAALGIHVRDLFPPKDAPPIEVARYDYVDENGTALFQVVRYHPKTFKQRKLAPDGTWQWGIGQTRRVLYRLPNILEAKKSGTPIYLVEGEKDVHAIEAAGGVATCNSGGAGKWRHAYTETLRGAHVRIVADRDEPGRAHARAVAGELLAAGCAVEMLEPAEGKDAYDHLKAGHTLAELAPSGDETPAPTHSWVPEPLDTDDEDEPEPHRVLGLFYPRLRHLVYGEPESLKTWLALCAVAEVIRAGGNALWIDHEMSARVIRARLRNLGCDKDARARVTYIKPTEALDEQSKPYLEQLLERTQPQIVVVDAYTGALGLAMLDDNSNIDVERWNQTVGALLWGPEKRTLIVLDHVNKDKETRGRWASGSKRKLEGADVAYSLETVKRLGRQPGQNGKATIHARKDRPAWLPSMRPGDLEIHVHDGGALTYTITPIETDIAGAPKRYTVLMEKVSRELEEAGASGLSKSQVEKTIGRKAEWVRAAIKTLVDEGFVVANEGSIGKPTILVSVRAYREAWDTSSTSSQPRPNLVPDEVADTSSDLVPPRPPPSRGTRDEGRGLRGTETGATSSHSIGSTEWLAHASLDEIRQWQKNQVGGTDA